MGVLTAAKMELDIRGIVPEAPSERVQSVQVLRHINAAYHTDVCARVDLPELDTTTTESTVASTATTTFDGTSNDILTPKGITDNTGQPLIEISANVLDRIVGRTTTTTGTPTHWYRTTNSTVGQVVVRWYPVPDAAVTMTLNYRRRPPELTISTATVIDTLYDEPIIYYAASRVASFVREFKAAKELRSYADSLLSSVAGTMIHTPQWRWGIRGESPTGSMR